MLIKVKCCDCGEILFLYSYEENRKKATRAKRIITDRAWCGAMDLECSK